MGQERAATTMNLVPPADCSDVATNSRFDSRFDAIDRRFDALDARLEIFENRIDAKLNAMQYELLRTLGTWLFLSQAAVIAAISVVIALVALG
jgi:hypothetical protein